jgi:hypothetical protein
VESFVCKNTCLRYAPNCMSHLDVYPLV